MTLILVVDDDEPVREYAKAVLEGAGATQRFVAVATYSDGRTRDVGSWALFQSNNETTTAIDSGGLATAGARGEAFVMARFDVHTVGSQVLVLPAGAEFTPLEEPTGNEIDELIGAKLRTLRIHPSPLCSDEEWCLQLLREERVVAQPGYFFDLSEGAHLVLSLIAPEPEFAEGATRLRARVDALTHR